MESKNNKQSLTSDTSNDSNNDKLSNENLNYENLSNLSDENVTSNLNQEEDIGIKVMPRAFSSSALRIKEKFSFWEKMHTGYDTDNAGCTNYNSPVR